MPRRQPLPNLTTIRLVAALYVFGLHFTRAGHDGVLRLGNTGVTLFFVLSGFILAYNYPQVENRKRFYALRFARIYPVYGLGLLFMVPRALHNAAGQHLFRMWSKFALCLAFLQSWWPPIHNDFNPAAWTLPVEVFFYLMFPLLLPWATRQHHRIGWWSVALALILVLPTTLGIFVWVPMHPASAGLMRNVFWLPIFHLGEFALGMLFGLHYLEKRPVFGGRHVALAVLLCVLWTAVAFRLPLRADMIITDGLMALPYALLLYALAGWESRWFAHPLLQLGGEISYSVYLLQFPMEFVLRQIMRTMHTLIIPPLPLLLLTLAASYLSYTRFEKPARLFIVRALGFQAAPKPIPTPGLQT